MAIDIKYVRKKYEKDMFFFSHMFFPCTRPYRLIVFFSSMGKDRYDRWSWFFDNSEKWDSDTACLFIKDDDFHYFLGTEDCSRVMSIKKLIEYYLDKYKIDKSRCYTVGGSMGGYAAIYYASFLELNGALVSTPQINLKYTVAHQYSNWERQIRECGSVFLDLCLFIHKRKIPNIYIEYGNYFADRYACEDFINSCMKSNALLVIRKTGWPDHTVDSLSRFTILNTIFLFENSGFKSEKAPRIKKNHPACVPETELTETT